MKLQARQLTSHLARKLASVYLVAGDEPLLVSEALEEIRARARAQGFEQRDLYFVERAFKWHELEADAENLSLFSNRRIIELRLPTPRPGDVGARTLRSLVERRNPDRLLLVATAKLDAVFVPLNFRARADELTYMVNDCAPKVLIVGRRYVELVRSCADDCSSVNDFASDFVPEKIKRPEACLIVLHGRESPLPEPCIVPYIEPQPESVSVVAITAHPPSRLGEQ